MLPLILHVAQRGEGIGGLTRLAHQQTEAAGRQRRRAIAKLAGDIAIRRQAGEGLQPDAADQTGIEGRSAGAEGDARDFRQIEPQIGQHDAPGAGVDEARQNLADYHRMLVKFLLHEVAIAAFADDGTREPRLARLP